MNFLKVSLVILPLLFLLSFPVHADDVTVSSNGSDSTNQAVASAQTTNSVSQNNTTTVSNTVSSSQNTGGNSTSGNTGGSVTTGTGDVNSSTVISNETNASTVNQTCCQTSAQNTATVSSNGSGSNNSVSNTNSTNNTVTVSQTATITNNVQIQADTGHNSANGNTGAVTVSTGAVNVKTQIQNGPVNYSSVSVPGASSGNGLVKIYGNGSGSTNLSSTDNTQTNILFTRNNADIKNILKIIANSGENNANENVGAVDLSTGNIFVNTLIKNGPLNTSTSTVSCCQSNAQSNQGTPGKQPETPSSPPSNIPSSSSTTSSSGGSSSGGNGDNGGSSSPGGSTPGVLGFGGPLLPETGSFWLFYITVLAGLMFLMGIYLRLHPGQDPGLKLAYVS